MPANIGDQLISLKYYDPADSGNVNKRFQGIRPVGIYSGGYLTVSGGNVDLSPLVCEISDGDYSVRVETRVIVNLPVAAGTPYVILRWLYTGAITDYMEILAVAAPVANDVVVGKCTFSGGGVLNGFVYNDVLYPRTKPDVQHLFLLVESTGEVERRVRIHGGRITTVSGILDIADQKSDLFPAHILNKVFLVYVNTSTGAIVIDSSGTAAASPVAPNYAGKLVLAEVTLASADTQIIASKIKDVRSFLTQTIEPDDTTIEKNVTFGKLQVKESYITGLLPSFGTWSTKNKNTIYQAATDGFVIAHGVAYGSGISAEVKGYTDGNANPTTLVSEFNSNSGNWDSSTITFPVRKGDYWKIITISNVTIHWMPFGS
jgi:hypothetical protein